MKGWADIVFVFDAKHLLHFHTLSMMVRKLLLLLGLVALATSHAVSKQLFTTPDEL